MVNKRYWASCVALGESLEIEFPMAPAKRQNRPRRHNLEALGSSAMISREITRMIRQRVLLPGDPLRERSLAERFGVSRGPVREALHSLAARGLVHIEPNRGARIARLTDNEVQELLDIGAALLRVAVRKAAENATPQEVKRITQRAKELDKGAGAELSASTFVDLQARCLESVLAAARAPRLTALIRDYVYGGPNLVYAAALSGVTEEQQKQVAEDWYRVTEAIAARNGSDAEQAIGEMHERGREVVRRITDNAMVL